tara:strand:+ start:387 stop:1163 length:777 start_codon:yes stop_codon:yes gene_type:complete
MKNKLQITIVQANLHWKNKKQNLSHFTKLLTNVDVTDIIILPEMFNTGFCPKETFLAETMNGSTIKWMKSISIQKKCAIAATLMIREREKIYNRFVFINEENEIFYYDKKHLFSLSDEDKYITNGDNLSIIKYKDWRICLQICYDLRFPVFSRNTSNYDLLIYSANWPIKRIDAWDTLIKARAIENQCYTVGVNRIGLDGNNFSFPGHSTISDPMGKTIVAMNEAREQVATISISKSRLLEIRKRYPFLADRDNFTID